MQIIGWTAALNEARKGRCVVTDFMPPHALLTAPEIAVQINTSEVTEAVVMHSPFGRHHRNDAQAAKWLMQFGDELRKQRPKVRFVFIDHPPNEWRMNTPDGPVGRKHPEAMRMFAKTLEAFDCLACQYGVNGDGEFPDIPISPVLWSWEGVRAMLFSINEGDRMVWIRGIGQWGPNGHAPTLRSFLHDLLCAWRINARAALVWYDHNRVSDLHMKMMAACCDIVSGLSFNTNPDEQDDFDSLLQTLAGGADFNHILDLLATMGNTGGDADPDLGGAP